jgi:putative membrane protein
LGDNSEKRVLVLCVDLDDDLGQKTGIVSPVVGRENVLSAGIRLGLVDPEESDSNAILASVKTYDLIRSRGDAAEVAIVTGSKDGEPFSSSAVLDQISKISKAVKPTDVYVVTDGFGDEDIVPVLRLKLPLSGIVRVVVKHSKTVEESYVVIGRYLKMLFTDERFKKYSLGFTGFSLMVLSLLAFTGYFSYALLIITTLLGLTAFVKGMSLDSFVVAKVRSVLGTPMPAYLLAIRILAFIAGYGLFVAGISLGLYGSFSALVQLGVTDPLSALLKLNVLGGEFLRSSSLYFLTGGIALQLGRATAFFVGDWAESRGLMISVAVMASLYPLALVIGDFLIDPNRFLQATVTAAFTSAALSIVSFIVLTGIHALLERRLLRQRGAPS